jgi:PIN domain nuclease of toxin-antitoxin system
VTFAIAQAIASQTLFLSQMCFWEFGLAMLKSRIESRPDLGGLLIENYIQDVRQRYAIRMATFSDAIALEAASVPAIYGFGDPGDCFLIATAHVKRLTLVTRDTRIIELANRRPDYVTVVPC